MKYLKTYRLFESGLGNRFSEIDYDGLTKEDIEDMFIDISDTGLFTINVGFTIQLVSIEKDRNIGNTKTTYGSIPCIEIRILNKRTDSPTEITSIRVLEKNRRMRELKDSEEFKSIVGEVEDRISEREWYISYKKVIQDCLLLILNRKEDSKYIK